MRNLLQAFAVALALVASPLVSASAQRSHIGVHAGYNFDINRALVGAQLLLPLGYSLELYPSVDYYLVDSGSRLGFSGDLKLRVPTGGPSVLYVGGGVNVLRTGAAGTSNTDTGADFFAGLESRIGVTHPYVEGRFLSHNGSTFQLAVGLNVTLF